VDRALGSSDDIIRERRLALDAAAVEPDFVCRNSIKEILEVLAGPVVTAATGRSAAQ
jgi:hypothetical protein